MTDEEYQELEQQVAERGRQQVNQPLQATIHLGGIRRPQPK